MEVDDFAELGIVFELFFFVIADEKGEFLRIGVGLVRQNPVDFPVDLAVDGGLICEMAKVHKYLKNI